MKVPRLLSSLLIVLILSIPAFSLAASTTTYTVHRGDTLSSIAKNYKTTVTILKQLDHLSSSTIYPGRHLKVPALSKSVVLSKQLPVPTKPAAPSKNTSVPSKQGSTPKKESIPLQPAATQPASKLSPIPAAGVPTQKEVLGYTVKYSPKDESSYNSILNGKSVLTSIATATEVVDGFGNLYGSIPVDQLNAAKANAIKPILVVSNNYDSNVATNLLSSAVNRQTFITNTLNILQTYGYQGVDVDLENIPSSQRNNYTELIKELSLTLKPKKYELSVAVVAKTADSLTFFWSYAYDYQALASYADYLVIMTYDEHYPTGQPGSVASIGWVTSVVNYALTVVPNTKIMLGLAAYGYDWGTGETTKSYGITTCLNLANTYNSPILIDSTTETPYFSYVDPAGVPHQVWFEDADSISYKLDLVNQKGLRGIGIWRLGLENEDYWNMISSKL